jgi:hypothetical protein
MEKSGDAIAIVDMASELVIKATAAQLNVCAG